MPSRVWRSLRRSTICTCVATSNELSGSSSTKSSGSVAKARAMAARCSWPPETSRGRRRAKVDGSRTCSSNSATRSSRAWLFRSVWTDKGLADTRPDVGERVEGRIRVLKDELHTTAQSPQTGAFGRRDVIAAEQDPPACRANEAKHQPGQGRLARTTLADESERPASSDGEIHVVDRMHRSLATPREADSEVTGHVDQLGDRTVGGRRGAEGRRVWTCSRRPLGGCAELDPDGGCPHAQAA